MVIKEEKNEAWKERQDDRHQDLNIRELKHVAIADKAGRDPAGNQ